MYEDRIFGLQLVLYPIELRNLHAVQYKSEAENAFFKNSLQIDDRVVMLRNNILAN